MPNLHPILVHFPIAILSLGLLFDLIALIMRSPELESAGWWSQLAGTVALAATVASGLMAGKTVAVPDSARATLEYHEQLAFLTAALYSLLLLWRLAARTQLPRKLQPLFLLLMVLALAALWTGGFLGGELVYRYGVGVR